MAIDKFKLQEYIRVKLQEEIEITSIQEQGDDYFIETTGGAIIKYEPKQDKVSKIGINAVQALGNILTEELNVVNKLISPDKPLSPPTGLQSIFNIVPSQQEILPEIDLEKEQELKAKEYDLGELQPMLTFSDEELETLNRKVNDLEEANKTLTTKEEYFKRAIENLLCKEHGDQFFMDYGDGSSGTCNPITLHSIEQVKGRKGPYEIYEVKYQVNSPDGWLPATFTREIKFKFEISGTIPISIQVKTQQMEPVVVEGKFQPRKKISTRYSSAALNKNNFETVEVIEVKEKKKRPRIKSKPLNKKKK